MFRQQSELLTVSQIAQILHRSESTVRRYIDRGTLPAIRLRGGMRLVHRSDVERFCEQRQATADAVEPVAQQE